MERPREKKIDDPKSGLNLQRRESRLPVLSLETFGAQEEEKRF